MSMEGEQKVFSEIFQKNAWASRESVSGTGSELNRTYHLRRELPVLLAELNVRSLLDLPCGDLNWMAHVNLGEIQYIGADIIAELIDRNRKLYASPLRRFESLDLTSSPLPQADAILCRDCLGHLPYASILAALENICSSGALYLLTTHFSFRTLSANEEIAPGQWRRLNFELAPFHWPPPQRAIIEGCDENGGRYADKSLSLWPIDQIRSGLANLRRRANAP
jgi:methyltransferase family protein